MIVGENSRSGDMDVNPTKEKKLTNIRTHSHDESLRLTPPRPITLEIGDRVHRRRRARRGDPASIRLRKRAPLAARPARGGRPGARTCAAPSDREDAATGRLTAIGRPSPAGPAGSRRTIPAMAIYLDHAATTPLRREVLDAMLPFLTEAFGNPSSAHSFGRAARAALDEAHERVAARLNAEAREIVFTSGGTEANNLAIKGAAWAGKARGHRIVTSPSSTTRSATRSATSRSSASRSSSCRSTATAGSIPTQLEAAITDRTILVSIMLANNEVGTIQPIAEIAGRRPRRARASCSTSTRSRRRRTSTSTSQALGADLVSLGAHKFEGPKGVGALYVRHGTHILAQQQGGDAGAPPPGRHGERRRRGRARRRLRADLRGAARDRRAAAPPARPAARGGPRGRPARSSTGHPTQRLPGLLSIIARDTDGASVAMSLDLEGIACSVGSACTTGSTEVSHVLDGDGLPGRGGARRAAAVARPDDDRRRDRDRLRGRAAGPRLDARWAPCAVAADPLGQGVPA